MGKLLIKPSPHLQDADSISKIMWSVSAALLPAVIVSIYFFGGAAFSVYFTSVLSAVLAELVCLKLRHKPLTHAADGSAVLTGLLTAMILPPGSAYFVSIVASGFAIAIVKHCFGGLGHNIWNPALAGRVFVQFAYPTEVNLSEWMMPRALFGAGTDAVTQPTPLSEAFEGRLDLLDMFLGNNIGGSIGETCKLALLIGGLFLIYRNIIDWRIPVYYIGTVFVLTAVLPDGGSELTPYHHILSGGLFLGAFFMATDMVTSPVTRMGRLIFAIGCGVLVAVIRLYGGYPEGVAYSILLMNTVVPLIDRYCKPAIYGSKTQKSG